MKYLLEHGGAPVGMIGTVRYDLGDKALPSYKTTPESADLYAMLRNMQSAGCTEAVMEVSSHGIDQERVDGLNLAVAAFLNLSQDHLDYHHTMDEYFRTKSKLFNGLNGPVPKVAIVNLDCPWGRRLVEEIPPKVRIVTFGEAMDADFRCREVQLSQSGTEFLVECPEGVFEVFSPLLGRYNVSNVLAASAIANAMGKPVSESIKEVGSFYGVEGRMQAIDEGQPYKVLVDYAHTPDALRTVLSALRPHVASRLICVFGAGGDRDSDKRAPMGAAVADGADIAIVTDDNPRTENPAEIRQAVVNGCPFAYEIGDRQAAIHAGLDVLDAGDVLLIAGKGHESGQAVGNTIIPFDDMKVASAAILHRGGTVR